MKNTVAFLIIIIMRTGCILGMQDLPCAQIKPQPFIITDKELCQEFEKEELDSDSENEDGIYSCTLPSQGCYEEDDDFKNQLLVLLQSNSLLSYSDSSELQIVDSDNNCPTIPISSVQELRCEICHKPFSTPVNLRRHKANHQKVQLFKCEPCNHPFTRSDTFKNHLKTSLHKRTVFLLETKKEMMKSSFKIYHS